MICGGESGEVQDLAATAMEHKGIFIGLKAAHQWIYCTVTGAEDRLHLSLDLERVGAGSVGIVVKTGTTAAGVALGIMVGDERQAASSLSRHGQYMLCYYLPEVRPAQMEATAEIAEWQDDARRCVGDHRNVDTSVHAFERGDGVWMFREVAASRQP